MRSCAFNTRDYRHPLVGPLTLTDEMLQLPDDDGQRVVVYTAQPDSPSQAALKLLTAAGTGRAGSASAPYAWPTASHRRTGAHGTSDVAPP